MRLSPSPNLLAVGEWDGLGSLMRERIYSTENSEEPMKALEAPRADRQKIGPGSNFSQ